MSVNTMSIEDAYTLMASLHQQATGATAVTPTDLSSFISVAQATAVNGWGPVVNGISQIVGKTIVAVRNYNRKFGGLEWTADKWAAVVRKLSFIDTDPISSPVFQLVDGSSPDMFEVKTPKVLETHYTGSVVYQGVYSIFEEQLTVSFRDPAEFASFMSGLMLHFSNEREQWFEELARSAVCNFIAAKADMGADVIHLLTEYNSATGLSLTSKTVRQPSNFPAFCKWCYARVQEISDLMTERSELFQVQITGSEIKRHTPVADQKIYLLADLKAHMEAEVLADTYHDSYLRIADTEAVNYWQSIQDPDEIQVTPTYIDPTGAVTTGSAQTLTDVVGVIFDRDAIGYNVYMDRLDATPLNSKGLYYNLFSNVRCQYQNDFTEKGVVLVLD